MAVEVRLIRRSSTEETRDGVTRSARTGPQSRALKARGQTTKASPVRWGDSRAFQLDVVARLRPHLGNCSAIRLPDLGACHRASQSRFERLTQIKPPALPGDTYCHFYRAPDGRGDPGAGRRRGPRRLDLQLGGGSPGAADRPDDPVFAKKESATSASRRRQRVARLPVGAAAPRQGIKTSPKCQRESTAETYWAVFSEAWCFRATP